MNYQEIENKLVEFAHKKEGKDFPIHDVDVGTAVEFAIELVKNCSIFNVVGQSEQLLAYTEWLKKEGLLNATVSKLIVKKYQSK